MRRLASQPGFVAGLIATTLLLDLGAARLLFSADREHVTIAGATFGAACAFRDRFGVPCPACGMTRSVVLTLHGDVATAAELNPGGPVAVFGLLYFSAAMVWLAQRQSDPSKSAETMKRRIQWSTAVLGGILVAVVAVHWIRILVELYLI